MTKKDTAVIALALAVFVGSYIVFGLRVPEEVTVVSDDGAVRVEGQATARTRSMILRRDDLVGPFTEAIPPVYEITSMPREATVEFSYDPTVLDHVSPNDLVILSFDPTFFAWRELPTVIDPASHRLMTEFVQSNATLFAVGVHKIFKHSNDISRETNALIAAPPPGAIGYRAYRAVSLTNSDFVLVDDALGSGGCDGTFHAGSSRTLTSTDLSQTGFTERIGVVWELGDLCAFVP